MTSSLMLKVLFDVCSSCGVGNLDRLSERRWSSTTLSTAAGRFLSTRPAKARLFPSVFEALWGLVSNHPIIQPFITLGRRKGQGWQGQGWKGRSPENFSPKGTMII